MLFAADSSACFNVSNRESIPLLSPCRALQAECCATNKTPQLYRKAIMKMRDSVPSEVGVDVVTLAGATRNKCESRVPREAKIPLARALAVVLAISLALVHCNSSAPTTPAAKSEPKAPALLSARATFYKGFIAT